MTKFKQLSLEQRYQIEALLKAGKNQTETANIVGVHKCTISRELKRNVPKRGYGAKIYCSEKAHKKALFRHEHKTKNHFFSLKMKRLIKDWMEKDRLSPELIYARAERQDIAMASHETIYKWIWQMKHSNKARDREFKLLYKYLKHGRRRHKRGRIRDTRGNIPARVSIEKRPLVVNKRKRIGDYEVDLMMGKNHQSALLAITDRATIKTKLRKLKGKNAKEIERKIVYALKKEKPFVKTITFDNDMAFANHLNIAKQLKIKTYFTRPFSSQDKGTIENRIGVIRMFYPKKTDFNSISFNHIKATEYSINNRPVRKFNYLTPDQLYNLKRQVAFIS